MATLAVQVLAAVDSIAEQMRARELAMVGIVQRYGWTIFAEILTPVQVNRANLTCRSYRS